MFVRWIITIIIGNYILVSNLMCFKTLNLKKNYFVLGVLLDDTLTLLSVLQTLGDTQVPFLHLGSHTGTQL